MDGTFPRKLRAIQAEKDEAGDIDWLVPVGWVITPHRGAEPGNAVTLRSDPWPERRSSWRFDLPRSRPSHGVSVPQETVPHMKVSAVRAAR